MCFEEVLGGKTKQGTGENQTTRNSMIYSRHQYYYRDNMRVKRWCGRVDRVGRGEEHTVSRWETINGLHRRYNYGREDNIKMDIK